MARRRACVLGRERKVSTFLFSYIISRFDYNTLYESTECCVIQNRQKKKKLLKKRVTFKIGYFQLKVHYL